MIHALHVVLVLCAEGLVRFEPETAAQALERLGFEHRLPRGAGGNLKLGQVVFAHFQVESAALRALHGVRDRGGMIVEQVPHLLAGLEVEFRSSKTQPVLVRQELPGAYAEENVVGFMIVTVQVVNVVGGSEPQAELFRDSRQLRIAHGLLFQAGILYFQIIPLGAEDLFEPTCR